MIDRINCLHNIYGLNENLFHVPRPCVLRPPAAVAGFSGKGHIVRPITKCWGLTVNFLHTQTTTRRL